MTNDTLSHVLRKIDLSKGKLVRAVDDLEAVLIENHKTVTRGSDRNFIGYYDYLVLLKNGAKAGIILNVLGKGQKQSSRHCQSPN